MGSRTSLAELEGDRYGCGAVMAAKRARSQGAIIGVAENGNGAVLVTLARDGQLLDRRKVELTPKGTPTHPYHHEGSWAVGRYLDSPWAKPTTLPEAVALVARVQALAARGAAHGLEALAATVTTPIGGIALRECPPLPETIEACIADHRAQAMADSVMYRQALAKAAESRGWAVHWYDRERVFREASLIRKDLDAHLRDMGRAAGPPWQAKHQLAAAAALAAMK